ncbi:flagellar hook protein FlgE [Paracraurococcus ruber]|uniref:Flagellar hook protein FlgE n=1 Tax=Paracraurococcus ruber TaxID=77675 RepID=A0ABS1CZS0_9PROT|nr:flagellar hook-basal body complex protein [Paracraurococcus ruber]MBK1659949.1 flagellar biosynthesis protein FlgE [Paracraurococcus ruber]TDG28845.1 flagellar hook-basal body complex protein [Paracraurococcus ruber]
MSALDALRTSLSGMNAQTTKLAGISNNIANSSTVGYKRVSTQFESLVLDGASSGSTAMAGTAAHNRVSISQVGQVQKTGVDTDIAVNGNGFFVVNEHAASNGKYLATRAGSFRTDEFGNLVNSAGYFLQGTKLGANGQAVGSLGDNNVDSLQTVNINSVSASAAPTTAMKFYANLPADQTGNITPPPSANAFQSSVDYYDPLGKAQTLTFTFTPKLAAAGAPDTNIWSLQVTDSATPAAGNPVASVAIEFNTGATNAGTIKGVYAGNGLQTDSASPSTLAAVPNPDHTATTVSPVGTYDPTLGTLTIATGGGVTLPIDIGAIGATAGMTQLQGDFTATRIEKDGSAFGLLQRVSVADDGKVMATFSNGQSRPIYQLKLALFANPDGLNPVRGDAYEMAKDAGAVRLLNPGTGAAGATSGGALEASNVDIGTELTNLIETQRAYSSNASVIHTADQMLQEAADLKR